MLPHSQYPVFILSVHTPIDVTVTVFPHAITLLIHSIHASIGVGVTMSQISVLIYFIYDSIGVANTAFPISV